MSHYRVVYKCNRCDRISKTRAKPRATAPNRCKKCGSSMTEKIKGKKV